MAATAQSTIEVLEHMPQDEADWLHNPHAGELLASEFMAPLGLDCAA